MQARAERRTTSEASRSLTRKPGTSLFPTGPGRIPGYTVRKGEERGGMEFVKTMSRMDELESSSLNSTGQCPLFESLGFEYRRPCLLWHSISPFYLECSAYAPKHAFLIKMSHIHKN